MDNKDERVYQDDPSQLLKEINHLNGKLAKVGKDDLKAFTMAAMQGLISNPDLESFEPHAFAHDALVLAKATLAALEKADE
jgi:hypothetical protein